MADHFIGIQRGERGLIYSDFVHGTASCGASDALHTMYYNFVRIHQTLEVTPAIAAGVTDKLWEMEDLVAMLEQWEWANFKPEYQFVVRQYGIGKGHSVSVAASMILGMDQGEVPSIDN
jgi:hypothetical protein